MRKYSLKHLLKKKDSVTISAEINGETKAFTAEKMLVSVGRQANVEGIGIDNTEIEVVNGFIKTRPTFQTKEHHIYAIGDVIGGFNWHMLLLMKELRLLNISQV